MQTARETLRAVRSRGLEFRHSEGQLAVTPRAFITADVRAVIKTHRDSILRLIELEQQPPCVHDVLEEFDGGHSRTDADRLALAEFGLASYDQAAVPGAGEATT